jgi:hypothetical protein
MRRRQYRQMENREPCYSSSCSCAHPLEFGNAIIVPRRPHDNRNPVQRHQQEQFTGTAALVTIAVVIRSPR